MRARITWLVTGAAIVLTLSTIACGPSTPGRDLAGTPLSPISPSAPIVPTSADTPTPSAATRSATLSGRVMLRNAAGVRPFAGANVWGWAEALGAGNRIGPVLTDAGGRYAFQVAPGTFVRVQVAAAYQPCVAGVRVIGDTTKDVLIITDSEQLGRNLPAELLVDAPSLSGSVFETTANGRQPVAGARVELDMILGLGDVSATTLTDSEGRYVLCGLAGHDSTYVFATKDGYRLGDVGTVKLHGNTVLDIELTR